MSTPQPQLTINFGVEIELLIGPRSSSVSSSAFPSPSLTAASSHYKTWRHLATEVSTQLARAGIPNHIDEGGGGRARGGRDYSEWILAPEVTVQGKPEKGLWSLELISPTFASHAVALWSAQFDAVFACLRGHFALDSSPQCGTHVHLSAAAPAETPPSSLLLLLHQRPDLLAAVAGAALYWESAIDALVERGPRRQRARSSSSSSSGESRSGYDTREPRKGEESGFETDVPNQQQQQYHHHHHHRQRGRFSYWCQSNRRSTALRGLSLAECFAVIDGGDSETCHGDDNAAGFVVDVQSSAPSTRGWSHPASRSARVRNVVRAMNLFPAGSAYGRAKGYKEDFVHGVFKWDFSRLLLASDQENATVHPASSSPSSSFSSREDYDGDEDSGFATSETSPVYSSSFSTSSSLSSSSSSSSSSSPFFTNSTSTSNSSLSPPPIDSTLFQPSSPTSTITTETQMNHATPPTLEFRQPRGSLSPADARGWAELGVCFVAGAITVASRSAGRGGGEGRGARGRGREEEELGWAEEVEEEEEGGGDGGGGSEESLLRLLRVGAEACGMGEMDAWG